MSVYLSMLKIMNFIFDTLLPIKCFNCKTKNQIFCQDCLEKTSKSKEYLQENMLAVFDYQDPIIKKAIWELKYHHRRYLGKKLGQLLYEHLLEDISEIRTMSLGQKIFIVPVPISKRKNKLRGYNQSEIIAKGFFESCRENIFELCNNMVYKKNETIPQAKISNKSKRLKNIKDTFGLNNSEMIEGRTIIIIDDVITTGATINEIIKILKKAKAKKVIGIAVAH